MISIVWIFLFKKQIFEYLLTYLGRDDLWTICSITDPDQLFLGLASEPFFNHRSDPIYARRLKEPEDNMNQNLYNCLIPITTSRLNRVITVIPQTIDLYEVFEPEELDSELNHVL